MKGRRVRVGDQSATPNAPATPDGPPTPDASATSDGSSTGTADPAALVPSRARRTWPQRALIGGNIALVLVCLSSAWVLGFYSRQLGAIPRIRLGAVLDRQDDPTKPLNILLVGADSDAGLAADDPVRIGRQGENAGDVIMILRVDPDEKRAALLSLPRDLWVNLPGGRGKGRINSTLALGSPPGNPELLIQTIQDNFHIKVNHYLQVDFAAFRSVVDALDGVNIWFDEPARDANTGLSVDRAGCRLLNGQEALAYARSRHYEALKPSGIWEQDPSSDLGRIARQQYFLKQAAKKAIARGARNPLALNSLIGVAQHYVKIDEGLSPQMILDIGEHFSTFNPDDLQLFTPYVDPGWVGGAAILRLVEEPSRPIFDLFRDTDASSAVSESEVRVEVRNGGGRVNLGRDVANGLAERGFVVTRVADEFGYGRRESVVRHAPGAEQTAAAVLVARYVPGAVTVQEDATLASAAAPVVLVAGPEVTAALTEPRPAADFADALAEGTATTRPAPATSSSAPGGATGTTTTLPPPAAAAFVPHPPPDSGC